MKAVFVTLGLIASFASFTAASPAADAASQLQGRSPEPIICIGCINDDCQSHSEPSGCAPSECTKACFYVTPGCRCCDVVDGLCSGDSYPL